MKNILVLEDSDLRIDWLKQVVANRANVLWAQNIQQFIHLWGDAGKIDLFILDHDLGEFDNAGYTSAKGGENGMQAVPLIPFGSRVFVWSANIIKAKDMTDALLDRGCATMRVPFLNQNKAYIAQWINDFLSEE